jgi:hypothetical protein
MTCSNNLKQLGLAVQNYASTYNSQLPPLTSSTGYPQGGNYQGCILITLLPYIEQNAIYQCAIATPGDTWDGNGNPTPRIQKVKTYICPSDPTNQNGWSSAQVNSWMGASYGANFQMFGSVRAGGNADAPQFGIGNIPDGTSNTIGFAETYSATNNNSNGNLWAYPGIDWGWNWTPVIGQSRSNCGAGGGVGSWNGIPQFGPTLAVANKCNAQSGHTQNVLVGLMDGSVRSVNSGITQATWQNALTPADGNVLASNW